MPRTKRPANPEEAARNKIGLEIERMINTLSSRAGPAADAESVSPDEQLHQWAQRDSMVQDPEALKRVLTTTGLGQQPDLFNPQNPKALGIIRANPDLAQQWAEMLSQPVDERMADLLVPLIEHPLRLTMLRPYEDDPSSAVSFADRMDARLQRQYDQIATAPVEAVEPAQQHPVMAGG
jgi:hypothetical protein